MSPTVKFSKLILCPYNLSIAGKVEFPSLWSIVMRLFESGSSLIEMVSVFAASALDASSSLECVIVPSRTGFHQSSCFSFAGVAAKSASDLCALGRLERITGLLLFSVFTETSWTSTSFSLNNLFSSEVMNSSAPSLSIVNLASTSSLGSALLGSRDWFFNVFKVLYIIASRRNDAC